MDLLKDKSWPRRQSTSQERGAYKLGQLTALDASLGGEFTLTEIPKDVLTAQDVIIVLEDLLLKAKLSPLAAQVIVQRLVAGQSA